MLQIVFVRYQLNCYLITEFKYTDVLILAIAHINLQITMATLEVLALPARSERIFVT